MKFRYDINGLRALAIIGVLLFHYKFNFIKGGFSGVDVFFVISGFLMTKIIATSIDRGDFSFWNYLQKRILRIVPALLVLLVLVGVLCFFLYFPDDLKLVAKNAAGSALFLSNILYWQNSNYFAPESDTNVLLHTWSLSVEWQFYMLYPFALLLLKKTIKSKRALLGIFVSVTALFFFVSILYANINPTAAFYLLPTRAWEMMFGGIAYLLEDKVTNSKVKKGLAYLGYSMIFLGFFFLDASKNWPSILTLLPVLGAFVVILANENEMLFVKNQFIQFIGKISYSLYLWHWPIYVIAQYLGFKETVFFIPTLLALSVLLSVLSYTYIENKQHKNSKLILASAGVVMLGMVGVYKLNLSNFLYKPETLKIASYQNGHAKDRDKQYRNDICHVKAFTDFERKTCLCVVDSQKNILLIGDSHMGMLAQSFVEKGKLKNVNFLQATASATLALTKDYQHRDPEARRLMDFIFKDYLPKNAKNLDAVIIGGSWSGQKSSIESDSILLKGIKETLSYLKKYNIKTVVLGQTERYTLPYPIIAARDFQGGTHKSAEYLDPFAYEMDKYLAQNLHEYYYPIINREDLPTISKNYTPYMVDNHHVSKYGADLIVDKLFSNPRFLSELGLN